MMLLMPVIEVPDSNSGFWCSITSSDGTMDSVWHKRLSQRANLLRSYGGSNYKGCRTGYFWFACLEIALKRRMKVSSTGRRSSASTYGGVFC